MFKALVKQIDEIAQDWLPLTRPGNEIKAWAALHGWNIADPQCQRLLIRQAVLNVAIGQMVPAIAGKMFYTPLDSLGVWAPQSLIDAIQAAAGQLPPATWWGELYNALIPQAWRRRLGQFWTNDLIAEWMVAWLLQFQPRRLADIGCGTGNFLRAAQRVGKSDSMPKLYGCDASPLLLNIAMASLQVESEPQELPVLEVQDYLGAALCPDTDAIVCNPPYTRHHHIAPLLKDSLQAFFKARLGIDVSRQGTLAFYFLLKLIAEMPEGAHAAVIVPMEVLDARYGHAAKQVLCKHTSLSAIIHFSPQMNAFHKVDVGASILLFKKSREEQQPVRHLTLNALPTTSDLLECLAVELHQSRELPFGTLVVQPQADLPDIPKWFGIAMPETSNATWQSSGLVVPLKALSKIVRGIATGANEFFVLPTQTVKQRRLESCVVRTLHRNREVQDIILDEADWQLLSDEGKCVWLLYLNGMDRASERPELQTYLAEGEAKGFHLRSLVQTRRKWYAMEQRDVPPIFFTILTRGNPRFILNRAGVRPLNMFLLVYPNKYVVEADAVEVLWALLNSSFSLSRLYAISRTYGGNTLKVEPRELDNLPVVNPLALPDEAQQKIKGWIDDFYRHRQPAVLTRHIDDLIGALLAGHTPDEVRTGLPLQPRLLEPQQGYDAKHTGNKPDTCSGD